MVAAREVSRVEEMMVLENIDSAKDTNASVMTGLQ